VSRQDRADQILEVKSRNLRGDGFLSYDLEHLSRHWSKNKADPERTPDFYVIRAVTTIEVFTRRNMASLIDHSEQYTERAVELSKHFKMDFDLIRHIQGRAITLGDIVAQSVPVNSFGQIIGYFETLIGKPLRSLLCQAIDRWSVEINKGAREPIIPDFDRLAKQLTRLFEVRHIICHELPSKSVYNETEIDAFLEEAIRFTKALQEVLTFEQFGLVPLTQTDMNIAAGEELRKKEDEMSVAISEMQTRLKRRDDEFSNEWTQLFNDSQEKWLAYRNAQCEFDTFMFRGGTIRSSLCGAQATQLTKLPIDELKLSLEKVSGPEYA
jgi:uncharacterized protein YecT (DUF1311 family)